MPKRTAPHDISDSDDDVAEIREDSPPQPSERTPSVRKKPSSAERTHRGHAATNTSSSAAATASRSRESPPHDMALLDEPDPPMDVVPVDSYTVDGSVMSFHEGDDDAAAALNQRMPQPFKVVEATIRPGRKQQNRMFAFVVDRSPSETDNLETYAAYILKRKLADAFMQMKFNKNVQHHCLVMTCCDSETDNLSRQEQEKIINLHCVELVEGGLINPGKVLKLKESLDLKPEAEQYSTLMCGLMTAADIINRYAEDNEGYSDIEIMIFSDLSFDISDPNHLRMRTVLKKVLANAHTTIVSDRQTLDESEYRERVLFLEEVFASLTTISYQEAMKKSEEWTMKELMPTKWNANIRLFGEDLPIEAYLICSEKNESLLENRMEKVGPKDSASQPTEEFDASMSTLRSPKQLVKLTDKGSYKKDANGALVIVDPKRTVMAYRFGTTAVPSSKPLKEYIGQEESYKGYIVKGWYPSHQFMLYLSGGKGYRVFSSASGGKSTVFDSLLKLCASRGRALLVDYAYAARFGSKPGVLLPHPRKHCFVFYELIYHDNMNYLPRYDPIATCKPNAEHLREITKVMSKSVVKSLDLKYDPFMQQVFEDVWEGRLDEMSRTFSEKFSDVVKETRMQIGEGEGQDERKNSMSLLAVAAAELAERAEGVVRRLVVEDKPEQVDKSRTPFQVEALDEDADELQPQEFSRLFR